MIAAPAIAERDLQAAVIDTARLFGWRVAHFRPAQTKHGWRTPVSADGKGFPDLVLTSDATGRLIFAELKSDRGKLTVEQEQWLAGLEKVAAACDLVEVWVWTPADWPERITSILTGRPATAMSGRSSG